MLTIFVTVGQVFAQSNILDSIPHQSYQRKFMVHFPPNFSTATERPLVINLHGGSGNMLSAQGFSQLNPVSDQNDFIVAWPQGIGQAQSGGFTWADGRNTSADQAGIDDIGFIDKLVDTLTIRYNVDTNKIYICGFSNGGFMVQRLACQLPNRFAAMASLGSSMDTELYKTCSPSHPIPMAFFNGTADPAMPYGGGAMQNPLVTPVVPVDTTVQYWVDNNNCTNANPVFNFPNTFSTDNSTAELYRYTDCDCNADVYFYKLINGGHTWPGVYIASQASVLGNTNRDIHASEELWDFFDNYSLCQNIVGLNENRIELDLKVYPNPANSVVQIDFGNYQSNFTVFLYTQLGKLISRNENERIITLRHLSNGIYFLTVKTKNGNTSRKLIIEK